MKWPAHFYFRQKTSEEKYGKNPPGTLVAPRLLNKKRAWRKPVQAGELKKKKLIFTDITYNKRTPYEQDKIDDILEELINAGFEIYNEHGIALTKQSVKRLASPSHYITQEDAARATSFPKDEICLLDDYLLTILKNPLLRAKYLAGEKIPREIELEHLPAFHKVSNYRYGYTTYALEDNIRSLLNANPPLTAIKITKFNPELMSAILNIVNTTFPSMPIHYEFSKWQISDQSSYMYPGDKVKAKAILYQHLGTIKKLDISRSGFFKKGNFYISGMHPQYEEALDYSSPSHVSNLEEIKIEGRINFEDNDLLHLLFANKDLDSLTINHAEIYETKQLDAALQHKTLPHLAVLDLTGTGASIAFLIRLLESSPNLRVIRVKIHTIKIDPVKKQKILATLYGLKARSTDSVDCDSFFGELEKTIIQNKEIDLTKYAMRGHGETFDSEIEYLYGKKPGEMQPSSPSLQQPEKIEQPIPEKTAEEKQPKPTEPKEKEEKIEEKEPEKKEEEKEPAVEESEEKSPVTSPSDEKPDQQPIEDTGPDVTFDENKHLNFKPPGKDFKFDYKGNRQLINQAMIIEQLSQYFILTAQYIEFLPKIDKGICEALTRLFNKTSLPAWDKLIADIAGWDGQLDSLKKNEDITRALNTVRDEFVASYVKPVASPEYYIGEQLLQVLSATTESLILANPWHVISVVYREAEKDWLVYDPNFKNGYKIIKQPDALLKQIEDSLGVLVSVKGISHKPTVPIRIPDKNKFIRQGGLLTLYRADNKADLLGQLPPAAMLKAEDMKGLLIRDFDGIPAWVSSLAHHLTNHYTLDLLQQFAKLADNFLDKLMQSMEVMTGMQKHVCIEQLIALGRQSRDIEKIRLINSIVNAIHQPYLRSLHQQAETKLTTWDKPKPPFQSVDHYFLDLMQAHGTNRMIEVDDKASANALQIALQKFCHKTSRPVYVIHSPDDLVCLAAFMQREGNKGYVKKGPGGPLHDFLMANQDKEPLIICALDNFNADDIVQANTLFDKSRVADGTPVPIKGMVAAIKNPNLADSYQGSDLYGRFHVVEQSPFTAEQLDAADILRRREAPSRRTQDDASRSEDTVSINLYHADDWEQRLLGQWVIQADGFYFKEGELAAAYKSGKTIEFRNPPQDNDKFDYFLSQLRLGEPFNVGDIVVTPPKKMSYQLSDGYDWESLIKIDGAKWSRDVASTPDASVLNTTLITPFFQRYRINNDEKSLSTLPGLIEAHAGKPLHIDVTNDLSSDLWAIILTECKTHKVQPHFHCAANIELPSELTTLLPDMKKKPPVETRPWDGVQSIPPTAVIQSTDADVTIALFTEQDPDWQVIDVSEMDASELLKSIDAVFNEETLKFEFTEKDCAVVLAKKEKKKIILTGQISDELANSLSEELLTRLKDKEAASKLVIVSDKLSGLGFMPSITHQVKPEEKMACFKKYAGEVMPSKLPNDESFTQWCARVRYLKSHPKSTDTSLAWEGVKTITGGIKLDEFDAANSAEKAAQFERDRITEYENVSAHSLITVLTGLTGVGKTSFVKNVLTDAILFEGIDKLDEALEAAEKGKVRLFLDEANAAHTNWSRLEGLMRIPPGILGKNGEFRRLTENQVKNLRVLLAMNPLSYGAERKVPTLIARHGDAMLMKIMPLEYVYEKILKPILEKTSLDKQMLPIAQHILSVYKFICECSKDEVLISPRELQMTALLVLSHQMRHPADDPLLTVSHYAYLIGKAVVPDKKKEEFAKQFKPSKSFIHVKEGTGEYKVTESRLDAFALINDYLDLHELRQASPQFNDAQKYGGIGGIILDGEPGSGKTEMILAAFKQRGWQEDKHYRKIPASMQPSDMVARIDETIDAGMYVWIDEINVIPLNERQWNNILMGLKSDGSKPKTAGGGVLASKNPDYMAGRRKLSKAIQRRTIVMPFANLTSNEMINILTHKGVSESHAKLLVNIYQTQRSKAEKEHLSPIPTFRDLVRVADDFIKSGDKLTTIVDAWQQFVSEQEALVKKDVVAKVKEKVVEKKDVKEEVKEVIKPIEKTPDKPKEAPVPVTPITPITPITPVTPVTPLTAPPPVKEQPKQDEKKTTPATTKEKQKKKSSAKLTAKKDVTKQNELQKQQERLDQYQASIGKLIAEYKKDIDKHKRGFTGLFYNLFERKRKEEKLAALIDMAEQTRLDDLITKADEYSHDNHVVSGKTGRTKQMIDVILNDERAVDVIAKKPKI